MEAAETKFRAVSSSRARKFNWEFLACWLSYFAITVIISYSLFSHWLR